ncbi:hypothetical protein Val02_28720 [Virgisporangium aliadipatigenens]|uniref:CAAX prenyl protease 2/Lysostaphin resistance protein A-like domain-containing protein n=1 Tax=Virgisporangium aliadipatigenens TaxID=741659 RepID=A0A8J4DQH4_9ACTN|nr:CPBP family glutamic-type intramembrane protease [Virgisporangium aliadipatigenens]GIJ45986.1 hypothetical protein Val02_28720 [Virgisporangium aliadipatigenens]
MRTVRVRLAAEYVLVFFVLVGGYAWLRPPGGPVPPLVLLCGAALWWLRRRPEFDRRDLWRWSAVRPALPRILALWAVATAATLVVVTLVEPQRLFQLPRQEPLLWLAIMAFYPLVSVYPQEVLFRAFLLHRYAPVFGSGWGVVAASAAAFGFAHIIFGNVIAVAATLVGGWMFARRYRRTHSLAAVCVEHALYGVAIFTVGLGDLFYHGTSR